MNILFLDSIERETYGGMEEWIRLVANGLAERGHTVAVSGRSNSEFLSRVRESSELVATIPLSISGDFNPATISKIKREIDNRSVDVVVTNFNKDIRLGGIAAKLGNSPTVVWSAGLDISKDNFIHRQLTPWLLDGVIVPSKALGLQIAGHGYIEAIEIEVIPIGIPAIDLSEAKEEYARRLREEFSLSDDAVIAVTSGRLVNQKGHRYLIEASPVILDQFPNLYFLLLGNGPLEADLKQQATEAGVTDHFLFAGMRKSVNELLAGSDLMIHPSIEEPFGIAILEGMRAGLPVVASDVGGIPEVVSADETSLLVEPKNAKQLCTAVCSLLRDSERMKRFGLQGYKRWQEMFSVSEMIKHVERYLSTLHSERRVHGRA